MCLVQMAVVLHPQTRNTLPKCSNPGCQLVLSQWGIIYDQYDEVVLGKERKKPVPEFPPEFGHLIAEYGTEECLSKLKDFYRKYIDQCDELYQKNTALELYRKTVELLQAKNLTLEQCLDRESGLLEIATKYASEKMPKTSCPECSFNKEITHSLRTRHAHNYDKIRHCENTREQVVDGLKNQIETLTDKVVEMKRKLMVKEDPFWQDVVVSELRQQIEQLKQNSAPQNQVPSAKPGVDPSTYVKIDPLSFTEPGAKEKLLSDPYIQKLALGNPDHTFYDESRFNERKLQSNSGFQPQNSAPRVSETVKLAFHLNEMDKISAKFRTLEEENMKISSKNRELQAQCIALEEEVSKMARQRGDLMTKLEQRNSLNSKLLEGECKAKFVDFFRVVEGDCKCLDENTMYDAFFGQLTEQERLSCIEWMYSSCHDGAKPRKRDLQEDNESRVGKKMFSSCLYAIGGVYKNSYKGQRYVWINIEMKNDAIHPTKRQRTLGMDSV